MANTNDLLRQRFVEALAERDAIVAETTPVREERDALLAKARAIEVKTHPLDEKIKALEAPLYDLNNEIGRISRLFREGDSLISKTAAE
jgi:predicted nuclease with TOPRIM domain